MKRVEQKPCMIARPDPLSFVEGLDGKFLLVREVPVHRNECVEGALHPTQKFAVLDTIPTKPADSLGVMTAK